MRWGCTIQFVFHLNVDHSKGVGVLGLGVWLVWFECGLWVWVGCVEGQDAQVL